MKKVMTMLGIAGMLCLLPCCKKNDLKPEGSGTQSMKTQQLTDSAQLYVLLNSKPCSDSQSQFSSATVDIRGIKVYNSELGWQDLKPVPGAWDVVSLQTAPIPIADITERSMVHAGAITKIALTFGLNNKLVVNGAEASCYRISTREVVLDLNGELKAGTLNKMVVSIDICGNITLSAPYQESPCYILKPVMAFQSLAEVIKG